MLSGFASCLRCAWPLALCALLGLAVGCDTAPGVRSLDPQPPRVTDLRLDVQVVADPGANPADSTARVDLAVNLRAADADGRVERVEMTLEPSQSPASTLVLAVPQQANDRYARAFGVRLPIVDDTYTVRAYAIDNDSLISNQVREQFRLVPTTDD